MSTKPPSGGPGAETRAQLVAAAGRLIAAYGWGAVSTRAVADRAGVNPALVHYHFRALPALLREAATGALEGYLAGPMVALADADSLANGAGAGIRAYADEEWDAGSIGLVVEATVQSIRDEALAERFDGLLDAFRAELSRRAEDEQRTGRLVEVDPAGLAGLLAALYDGLALQRLIDPGTPIERVAQA